VICLGKVFLFILSDNLVNRTSNNFLLFQLQFLHYVNRHQLLPNFLKSCVVHVKLHFLCQNLQLRN